MVRIIKKVKIGFFEWTVHFQPLDGSDHGSTDSSTKQIFIDCQQSEQCQRETLFHELLHAGFEDCPSFKMDYDNADIREEDIIRFISPRMMQIITDNKWLQEYLWKKKKKK